MGCGGAGVAAATKSEGTTVKNIREQTAQTVSSITTVDLTGISHIEEAFAILGSDDVRRLFGADNAWDTLEEILLRYFGCSVKASRLGLQSSQLLPPSRLRTMPPTSRAT